MEEVGESVNCNAQVCLGARRVALLEPYASSSVDREPITERCIKACRSDNRIDGTMCPIDRSYARGVYMLYTVQDDVHIIGNQSFQVARTGRKTLAQRREVGNKAVGHLTLLV